MSDCTCEQIELRKPKKSRDAPNPGVRFCRTLNKQTNVASTSPNSELGGGGGERLSSSLFLHAWLKTGDFELGTPGFHAALKMDLLLDHKTSV